MENKFYVPQIEEFYVGFECEYQEPNEKEWIGDILMDRDVAYLLAYPNKARVKYLDKEDIESFGFKYNMTSYNGYWTKDNIELGFAYDKRVQITSKEGIIFLGIIKNKSELKVLLKQLGIC